MPIEFRCPECGRLLRTADDTAGRQAKCPACGHVTPVPEPGELPPEPAPSVPEAASDPFARADWSPFEMGDAENPYRAPAGDATAAYSHGRAPAADQVSGPAIGLMITGGLGIAAYALGIVWFGFVMAAMLFAQPPGLGGPGRLGGPGGAAPAVVGFLIWLVFFLIAGVISWVILLGGIRMRKLQSYSLAMAASILAMIPCIGVCCCLGLPFGIWGLVVLLKPEVKAAFH